MPSTFIFGSLKLKRRSCEIPLPKNVVCSDVVLEKPVSLSFLAKMRKVKL